MATQNTMNSSNPSIYIPSVYSNIGWRRIKDVFEEIFGKGTIGRVDVVKMAGAIESGTQFNRVFVHFKYWPKEHDEVRLKLVEGGVVKIVYEDPWFWKCMLNKYPRTVDKDGTRRPQRSPYLEVDEAERCESPPRLRREKSMMTRDAAKNISSNPYQTLVDEEDSETMNVSSVSE